jgi:hypothetical protein
VSTASSQCYCTGEHSFLTVLCTGEHSFLSVLLYR